MLYPAELPGLQNPAAPGEFGVGGAEEDRTPDLRIANATLSQLSYGPTQAAILAWIADTAPVRRPPQPMTVTTIVRRWGA